MIVYFIISLFTVGLLYLSPAAWSVNASLENLDLPSSTPNIHTPQELKNVWLRFHKDNLCQKIDAAFTF